MLLKFYVMGIRLNVIINVPNVLSFVRIILTPLFLWLLFQEGSLLFLSVLIFTVAALTDSYDGYIARRFGQVTELGNFLDPIADKILIFSTFYAFYVKELVSLWFVVLLIVRDTMVTVLRLFMVRRGKSLVTSKLGKWKTVMQFIAIYLIFIHLLCEEFNYFPILYEGMIVLIMVVMYLIAAVTLYSGIDYVVKNRKQLWSSKS